MHSITTKTITILVHATVAKRHLLHSGGNKGMDLYLAQGDMPVTYAGFKAILNARFVSLVNKWPIFTFWACQQDRGQTLEDYITKLQKLAVYADIPLVQRENKILHKLAQNTTNDELRLKALLSEITLAQLKRLVHSSGSNHKVFKDNKWH